MINLLLGLPWDFQLRSILLDLPEDKEDFSPVVPYCATVMHLDSIIGYLAESIIDHRVQGAEADRLHEHYTSQAQLY